MKATQKVEDKNLVVASKSSPSPIKPPKKPLLTFWINYLIKDQPKALEANLILTITLAGHYQNSQKEYPYKQLTHVKLQLMKEHVLCLKCDEKFIVGHKCKSKELRLLMVHDETVGEEWKLRP